MPYHILFFLFQLLMQHHRTLFLKYGSTQIASIQLDIWCNIHPRTNHTCTCTLLPHIPCIALPWEIEGSSSTRLQCSNMKERRRVGTFLSVVCWFIVKEKHCWMIDRFSNKLVVTGQEVVPSSGNSTQEGCMRICSPCSHLVADRGLIQSSKPPLKTRYQ